MSGDREIGRQVSKRFANAKGEHDVETVEKWSPWVDWKGTRVQGWSFGTEYPEAEVEVTLRNGSSQTDQARYFHWGHLDNDVDIVKFRWKLSGNPTVTPYTPDGIRVKTRWTSPLKKDPKPTSRWRATTHNIDGTRLKTPWTSPLKEDPMPTLPTDAAARKDIPLATGLLDYFPDALVAVAAVSRAGQKQHGTTGWDRSKSTDEADCLMRHFMERGTVDTDGQRHSAKVAWRALALLQKELEVAAELRGMSGE